MGKNREYRFRTPAAAAAVLLGVLAPWGMARADGPGFPPPSANVSVYASGLDSPRGITFGPDGNLYVAEAGHGGSNPLPGAGPTAYGKCIPAGPEAAENNGGYSGKIESIDGKGNRTTVVSNLPSGLFRGSALGPAAVTFVNGTLYGLLDAGCTNVNRDIPSGVIQVSYDGTWSIYDLSTWAQQHPPAQPDAADFAPDGSWYGLTSAGGLLYAVNPNGGQVVRIDPRTAQITLVADVSATYGHVVPTAMTYHNGNLYTCTLGLFPQQPGQQKVLQITPSGAVSVYASGLTSCVGLAWDTSGNLFAVNFFSGHGPGPASGQVVKVNPGGAPTVIASGLSFPTAITVGPDGLLYVSNIGAGVPFGGQIVRMSPTSTP